MQKHAECLWQLALSSTIDVQSTFFMLVGDECTGRPSSLGSTAANSMVRSRWRLNVGNSTSLLQVSTAAAMPGTEEAIPGNL